MVNSFVIIKTLHFNSCDVFIDGGKFVSKEVLKIILYFFIVIKYLLAASFLRQYFDLRSLEQA